MVHGQDADSVTAEPIVGGRFRGTSPAPKAPEELGWSAKQHSGVGIHHGSSAGYGTQKFADDTRCVVYVFRIAEKHMIRIMPLNDS